MKPESSEDSNEKQLEQETIIVPRIRNKEALRVTFEGIIQSGRLKGDNNLSIMYGVLINNSWDLIYGQKSGISQYACSDGDVIVWNFPFGFTFEMNSVQKWPQIAFAVYGKDWWGRSIINSYGNIHLPTAEGDHKRTVYLFKPMSHFSSTGFCAKLCGYLYEYKNYQSVLSEGENRECIGARNAGTISIKLNVRKKNFDINGYD